MESEVDESRTKLENCKYYVSLVLGSACILCIFAFLFLVPFVLDPAISTLMHEFVDSPVACRVSSVRVRHGKSNCHWSSCREGCTSDMYVCYQVRVAYSRQAWNNGSAVDDFDPEDWVDLTRFDEKENATMSDTPLLVNIKGCGYPPDINCAGFARRYQNISEMGETFPCFYSKMNPWIVLETYSYSDTLTSVLTSILVPNGLFIVSLIVLLYWYCPYCQARCRKYQPQNNNDEKELPMDIEDDEEPQNAY